MSGGKFLLQGGKGTTPSNVVDVLRYVPRIRDNMQNYRVRRQNMLTEDLNRFWDAGRSKKYSLKKGYSMPNSSANIEGSEVPMIPRQELEKYMPDIHLGPKALVTPVSLMHARHGHRVTHDFIHAYDPHIGAVDKPAWVDHDNVTPHDPNHVGLHPSVLFSAGRIYRWLRRSPFSQEVSYFRRYVAPQGDTCRRLLCAKK